MSDSTCPRRMLLELGPWERVEGRDDWRTLGNGERTCSFCGSLHPDDFMARVHASRELIPTDKNYKAYIEPGHQKFYYQHLNERQRARLIELANDKRIRFGYPGWWYQLPFFITRGPKQA